MDDSASLWAQDTTDRLISHLKSELGDGYTYYEAWPNVMPPTFPVIIVQLLTAKPVLGPTQTDEVPEIVEVTIMLNQADAAGSQNVRTTTRRHLQHLVQGQDPATNQYKEGTVLHALRTYLTLDAWLINADIDIKYDIVPPQRVADNGSGHRVSLNLATRDGTRQAVIAIPTKLI